MRADGPWCQRWGDRRHSWRHTSEGGFDPGRYEVALSADEGTCKDFVVRHHYSASYPAARLRAILLEDDGAQGRLVGVAVLGIPMSRAVLSRAFPRLEPYRESLELSRFVLLDEVPANAESWFLARAFRLAASEGVRGVVSFADPVPRHGADGTLVFPGHMGIIYRASNGLLTAERGTPRTLLVGPDGRVLSARALQKIRRGEQGSDYAERQLVGWGARARGVREGRREWLSAALGEAGVRRLRHPGNLRYLFRLGRTRIERSRVAVGLATRAYPCDPGAPERPPGPRRRS